MATLSFLVTPMCMVGLGTVSVLIVVGVVIRAYTRDFDIGNGTYRIHKVLGTGTAGTVCRARTMGGESVAIKWNWNGSRHTCDSDLARYVPEHPNLVGVLDVGRDSVLGAKWVVMEYVEGESLQSFRQNVSFDPWTIRSIFVQMCRGVAALHEHHLIHRDLIPRNVLYDARTGRVKVCDYGMMRRTHTDGTLPNAGSTIACDYESLSPISGPTGVQEDYAHVSHMNAPPEELDRKTVRSQTVDTWMVACILVFLVTGRDPPYPDRRGSNHRVSIRNTFVRTRAWESWSQWTERFPRSSSMLLDLVRGMFVMDPLQRATVRDCLNHPWCTTTQFP